VSGPALKRTSRYWNDDLYPCIEKYCGQYVHNNHNTNLYVRCLSKYCQRGVLTVPAREIEDEEDALAPLDVDGEEDNRPMGSSDSEFGSESLLKDQVFTLIAYCHQMLCPLDHEQDFSVFWNCAEDKCVPWFESAWRQQHPEKASGRSKMSLLKGAIEQLKPSQGNRGLARPKISASTTPVLRCTEDRIGEPGCDWKTLYEQKNAPLARKRRINDDVSQCIQSYCGGKNDLSQRMFCVIKHCHRIRSFN
jgi:hypothetical protein